MSSVFDQVSQAPPAVIYDLGSNNGDDIPYYLLKADKVVAVEANPALARHLRTRFEAEIADGRVAVENCALTVDPAISRVPFFIHRSNDLLSQLPRPRPEELAQFEELSLPSLTLQRLLERHGPPHYVKIDLEGYDKVILRNLFENGCFPPYVSAEAHTIDTFCILAALGGYDAFKVVLGHSVPEHYPAHTIRTPDGFRSYEFTVHTSGPFGNDIPGPWMSAPVFMRFLAILGTGWIDIHASRVDGPQLTHARKVTEIASNLLMLGGMHLGSKKVIGWSRRLWGVR